ncbi:hypothetical protein XaC1_19 [Xanthomonas phage XaC1]|nr:hypothetical protein XaC1_19 [Xanthomonas phage XaC1]
MLGTPHNKAYKYNYFFIDSLGVQCRVEKVICLVPGAPNIHKMIIQWNHAAKKGNYYELIGEIPVKEALLLKSTSGSTIRDNWKFLGNLLFHSIELSFNKVLPKLA